MTDFIPLGVSAVLNIAMFAYCLFLRRKPPQKPPQLDLTAADLLHDLTRGPAVIRVEVIDAKNLLLRSPRA